MTLAIQNAESGGDFEYSPYLRTSTDENYAGVASVLDGDPELIRTLRLEPGMVGSPERTRQLYGRVLPIHIERAGLRADALVD